MFHAKPSLNTILSSRPKAIASVFGNSSHKSILGTVKFYQTSHGVAVLSEISGLPSSSSYRNGQFFALHIHSGESCTGNDEDNFADAKSHYNPHGYPHPYHAGDLPPLFSNDGYALSLTLTGRFELEDVIGRVIVIHDSPDDFTSQPAGNSGKKIACGKIKKLSYYN